MSATAARRSPVRAWFDLARAGNFPSVVSNVLAALVLSAPLASISPDWPDARTFLLAALAGCLIYAGGATLNDVIDAGFEPGEGGLVEAQKPVKLMRLLLELCTRPGSLILDPFAGSGTTAIAAREAGRRCLCIERNPDLCRLAERRLAEAAAGARSPQ